MSIREPKSQTTTLIEVVGRSGGRKGRLELTSGNVTYFRVGAQTQTLSLTYQQLLSVLERELAYQQMDAARVKLPKSHEAGDFTLEVIEITEAEDRLQLVSSKSTINKLDPRRVDLGAYQFSDDMAGGRKSKKYKWFAHVSIQAALWIVDRYIEKFLVTKKMSDHTDDDVVVSKQKMRDVLLMMLKKIDTRDRTE